MLLAFKESYKAGVQARANAPTFKESYKAGANALAFFTPFGGD